MSSKLNKFLQVVFPSILGLVLISGFVSKACATAVDKSNANELLIAKILGPTPIYEDLRHLTDHIGGRPTGSDAMNKAVQWGLKRFIDAGYKDAHLESYVAPRNWLPLREQAELIIHINPNEKIIKPLRVAAMPFTHATPADGLTAPVYAIDFPTVNIIQTHAAKIKGHWLLVSNPVINSVDDLLKEYRRTLPIFNAAKAAGAVGVLWQSTRYGLLLYRHNAYLNGSVFVLPAAVIEREGSEHIIRSLKAGEPVEVKAILQNTIQEKPQNFNVVAEIKGTKKPEEFILLGAHLDSWDLGQGALDNGSNAALVIDAARQMQVLQQQGVHPERTIRFMLYSGEEFGFYGSWFDTKKHAAELDSIKAVIIYDIGTGRTTGFSLGGRVDMLKIVNQILEPIKGLGPFMQTLDAFVGTDNFDYLLKGIPTLVANQDASPYLMPYHASSDTFDKVDPRELKLNTVIASVLTWSLANSQEPLPHRQSLEEVIQLLKSTGAAKEMQAYNIWNDFLQQKR